ncbi:MAG: hypothetical protein KBC12_00150 [Candidatus Pacebacteria bacterium]|nr:hypothetical protein [Candidatus Paceibacterota bacterium]MBP9851601.1 hypothetical protein [Candidatus Paceibacterota bacterium]
MKIGYVQYSPVVGEKETNLETVRELLRGVSGDLFVLPEMGMTGYPDATKERLAEHAEKLDGFLVSELTKIAKEKDACIIVGLPEVDGDKVYNTTVVVGPDGLVASHQKSHLFMEEKKNFTPGTTNPTVFEWKGDKIGVGICYDYMFPEFWRKMAFQGVRLFCNTANFVSEYGFPVMRTRSIENGVFSITTNRTGMDGEQMYKGGSEIIDNRGHVLVKASDFEEEVEVVDVDLSLADDKNWNGINDLMKDRREEIY